MGQVSDTVAAEESDGAGEGAQTDEYGHSSARVHSSQVPRHLLACST